jgi:hypothetical protein
MNEQNNIETTQSVETTPVKSEIGISVVIPRLECKGCDFIVKNGEKKYNCINPKRKGGKSPISMKELLLDKWNKEGNYTLTDKAEDIDTSKFKKCPLLKA